jgi:hypothetical protein
LLQVHLSCFTKILTSILESWHLIIQTWQIVTFFKCKTWQFVRIWISKHDKMSCFVFENVTKCHVFFWKHDKMSCFVFKNVTKCHVLSFKTWQNVMFFFENMTKCHVSYLKMWNRFLMTSCPKMELATSTIKLVTQMVSCDQIPFSDEISSKIT